MSTVCQRNKEKKRNTYLHVKNWQRNIISLLSYEELHYFSPFPFSPHLNLAGGFHIPRPNIAFPPHVKATKSGRGGVGGGLGSPLAAFPQTQKLVF
jgi:hypothetical protein